jgi:hypothetical protein
MLFRTLQKMVEELMRLSRAGGRSRDRKPLKAELDTPGRSSVSDAPIMGVMGMDEGQQAKKTRFTREEVLDSLRSMASDFESIEKLLNIPSDNLFLSQTEREVEYVEKEGQSSMHLSDMLRRAGSRLPPLSSLVFSIGFFDTTSQTYFFLCDPQRKIVVIEPLLYLGKGSWQDAAYTLSEAIKTKNEADGRGEKYDFVVGMHGSASLVRSQ